VNHIPGYPQPNDKQIIKNFGSVQSTRRTGKALEVFTDKAFRAFFICVCSHTDEEFELEFGPQKHILGQKWVRNQKLQREKSAFPIFREGSG
jgi:hypothetical protein